MTTVDLAAAQSTDDQACLAHPEGTRRRTALLGIAVAAGAVCAGCSSSKSSGAAAAPSNTAGTSSSAGSAGSSTGTSSASSSDTGSTGSTASSSASGAAGSLAATSAVPVGGGTVLTDQKIVLTQPTAGTYKAFTAICTHQGCVVGTVQNGLIVCPCHGSSYHIADGSVANGPASQPLAPIAIKVAGGEITQA